MHVVFSIVNAIFAGSRAPHATGAALWEILELWLRGEGLRVMAPAAVVRAAFQEYCCPYPRPVMQSKPLDIENRSASHVEILSKCASM